MGPSVRKLGMVDPVVLAGLIRTSGGTKLDPTLRSRDHQRPYPTLPPEWNLDAPGKDETQSVPETRSHPLGSRAA